MKDDKNKKVRRSLSRYNTFLLPEALAMAIDAYEELQPYDENDEVSVFKGSQLVVVAGAVNAEGKFSSPSAPLLLTILNNATANVVSDMVDVSMYRTLTFHIISANVDTGATVTVSYSLTGLEGEFKDMATVNVTTNGLNEIVSIDGARPVYVRVSITNNNDGSTHKVILHATD